ncbi:hypothetical protein P0R31_40345 [Bradyrhizobium yuanmingense]|uniref:hypothetical protein n=1 Tax=Bradyrhizobium yuanmingense TaxID=108015 RepID=UPI0023B9A1FA|nr:hypothetical protein [Bradyrhizobium yuanmingense]MDF0523420.1 hypothetical protein [Bradyrhizobium yuanmingense]
MLADIEWNPQAELLSAAYFHFVFLANVSGEIPLKNKFVVVVPLRCRDARRPSR